MRFSLPKLPEYSKRWILLDALGIIVGLIGGLGAIVFRYMLDWTTYLFFNILLPLISFNLYGFNIGLIALPSLGGLIVGIIVMKFAPETKGHGVPEVMEAVALKGGRIRKRVAFMKVIVSSITIGSGGSAGREGPIAQIGSTIGSIFGQAFKLDPRDVRLLVVSGMSAGIAGTFNAPLGGAIFGLEILFRGIGVFNAVPVILASVVGAATASSVLGQQPSFIAPILTSWNPQELIFFILLGAIFGIISVVWVKTFYSVEDIFENLKIPGQLKPALGGLLTGLLVMLFLNFGVNGVGYEGVNMALAGELSIIMLLLLGIVKLFATSFTVGSGGSGGIFAPSLFIGAMFGGALGLIFQQAFPLIVDEPFIYVLIGMGALFAGSAQAPLNVILMIPEMSGSYTLIAPMMASSVTSFFVAWMFLKGSSIYTIKLERRGLKLRMGRSYVLDSIKVEEVMTKDVLALNSKMPVSHLELIFEEHHHMGYPVIDGGELMGIITVSDIQKIPHQTRSRVTIGEAATKNVIVVYPDETVHIAEDKIYENKIGRLPVVSRDDPKKIVGIISRTDIICAQEIVDNRSEE
ncbi:chloride channel protein [Thermoproteota archaeon]